MSSFGDFLCDRGSVSGADVAGKGDVVVVLYLAYCFGDYLQHGVSGVCKVGAGRN